MDEDQGVRIGLPGACLILRTPEPRPGQADYITAEADLPGIHATRRVYLYQRHGLARYFSGLAESWRGWEGPASWASIEGDLVLTCFHDGIGHVVAEFSLGDAPPPGWATQGWSVSGTVVVEPGALQEIATRLQLLTGP